MNNLNHYEFSLPGRFVTARCWGQWVAQCESAPTGFSKRFLLTPSTKILTTWLKAYHPFRSIYGAFTQFLFLPYIFDRSHCPKFFLDFVRYLCQEFFIVLEELFKFLNDNIIICLVSSGRERFRSRYLRPAGVQWSRVRGRCRHLCPWVLFAAGTHRASLVCWALRRANIAHCPRSWPTCSLDLRPRSHWFISINYFKSLGTEDCFGLDGTRAYGSYSLSVYAGHVLCGTSLVRAPPSCPILLSVPFDLDFIWDEQNKRTIYKEIAIRNSHYEQMIVLQTNWDRFWIIIKTHSKCVSSYYWET